MGRGGGGVYPSTYICMTISERGVGEILDLKGVRKAGGEY